MGPRICQIPATVIMVNPTVLQDSEISFSVRQKTMESHRSCSLPLLFFFFGGTFFDEVLLWMAGESM